MQIMIEVLFFGQLTDITRTSSLACEAFADTDSLIGHMKERFPGLRSAMFMVAVDNTMITSSIPLKPGSRIALMPPFSGG